MPSYLLLLRFTEQGIRHVKDIPQRREAYKQAVARVGGRVVCWYLTLGEYDIATVAEFPDDAAAAQALLALGALGNVRTTTLKAFSEAEFDQLVAGLP